MLKVNSEILPCVHVVSDVVLKERNEIFLKDNLDRDIPAEKIIIFVPRNRDKDIKRGVLVAKQLLRVSQIIPVSLMNVYSYPINLRKGSMIVYVIPIDKSPKKIPMQLENLITIACEGFIRK